MKKQVLASLLSLCVFLIGAAPGFAHHGYAGYELDKTVSVLGTVTDFQIMNPHSTISFDVKGENGTVEHWIAEAGHVRLMRELGWSPDTMKVGDKVTFFYHPAKNGAHTVDLVKITLADGKTLYAHSTHGVNE